MKTMGDTPTSCLPTRRRYQTPLKPSRLQNINSVRGQSQNSKKPIPHPIKISESIIVEPLLKAKGCDNYPSCTLSQGFNTHFNSTFESTPQKQTPKESLFERMLKDTNCRVARSILPQNAQSRYQYIDALQDTQDVEDSQNPKPQYVILSRNTFQQLLRNDWVCSQVVPPSVPRVFTTKRQAYKF